MKIHESAENYLETIYILSQESPPVRAVDIAAKLNFSKPSVSVAMKNLQANNLIAIDSSGHISLTDSGHTIAVDMYERHVILSNWLTSLGVDKETAAYDACKMEHAMSKQSFTAIKQHILDGERESRT